MTVEAKPYTVSQSDKNIGYTYFWLEIYNSKQMNAASRPVSPQVLVRAKSERSDWTRLQWFKTAKRIVRT